MNGIKIKSNGKSTFRFSAIRIQYDTDGLSLTVIKLPEIRWNLIKKHL